MGQWHSGNAACRAQSQHHRAEVTNETGSKDLIPGPGGWEEAAPCAGEERACVSDSVAHQDPSGHVHFSFILSPAPVDMPGA